MRMDKLTSRLQEAIGEAQSLAVGQSLVPAAGDAAKVARVTALAAGRSTRVPQAVPVTPHIRKYHPVTLATDELAVAKAWA